MKKIILSLLLLVSVNSYSSYIYEIQLDGEEIGYVKESLTILATSDEKTYQIYIPNNELLPLSIGKVIDLDGNGYDDLVLNIIHGYGGNCCPNSHIVISAFENGKFVISDIFGYDWNGIDFEKFDRKIILKIDEYVDGEYVETLYYLEDGILKEYKIHDAIKAMSKSFNIVKNNEKTLQRLANEILDVEDNWEVFKTDEVFEIVIFENKWERKISYYNFNNREEGLFWGFGGLSINLPASKTEKITVLKGIIGGNDKEIFFIGEATEKNLDMRFKGEGTERYSYLVYRYDDKLYEAINYRDSGFKVPWDAEVRLSDGSIIKCEELFLNLSEINEFTSYKKDAYKSEVFRPKGLARRKETKTSEKNEEVKMLNIFFKDILIEMRNGRP